MYVLLNISRDVYRNDVKLLVGWQEGIQPEKTSFSYAQKVFHSGDLADLVVPYCKNRKEDAKQNWK